MYNNVKVVFKNIVETVFFKSFKNNFFKIIFLFLNYFDPLVLKIIFLK